jgi:hypothetical protein
MELHGRLEKLIISNCYRFDPSLNLVFRGSFPRHDKLRRISSGDSTSMLDERIDPR